MATPSLAMIPSAYADSKVYSVLPNNGDGDFTFNRDSSATRVGQNGLIQTVGYFGSEEVTNGDFATDSDWNKGAGWTISGGTANCDGTANNAISQNFSLPTGTLRIKFDITARTQGSVNLWINKPAFTQLLSVDAVGSYEVDVVTTSGANNIYFYSASNFSGSIDNVSVQQILGDQPRLNYDISNGVVQSCPSLLLEPASTNSLLFSEDYTNSVWTSLASGETIVSNSVISPDGTLNADTLEGNGSTTNVYVRQDITLNTSVDYTFSIFAKKGTNDFLAISAEGFTGATNTLLIFDLNNSIVTTGTGSIENYGNGWLRCSFTISISTDGTGRFLIYPAYNGTTRGFPSASDSNGKNIYIWGAQVEALSYATSYIPTSGASQTRAAETCDGAGNAATFNSTEGVLYVEISALANDQTNRRITLSDGSNNNRIVTGYNTTSNQIFYFVVVGSSTVASGNYTSSDITQFSKIAIKFKVNDFALWVDGIERQTDTSGAIFSANTLSSLQFEQGSGGALFFYGNTKDIRVYNEALTDAQLQTLTTL